MMRTTRRLLALDMDGTLLRTDLSLSDPNRLAVARCLEQGVHVVLATGRVHVAAAPYARYWPGHPVLVASANGAVIRPADGGPALLEQVVDLAVAREVVTWAEQAGLHLRTYVDDQMLVYHVTEQTIRFSQTYGVPFSHVPNLGAHLANRPTKLVLLTDPAQIPTLEGEIRQRWGHALEVTGSTPDSLEMTGKGVSKGAALRFLGGHLGVDRARVATIGNERNDLSMIEWAGYGAVVANAAPIVRAQAPRVVATNDEDGVAAFIDGWLAETL